MVVSKLTRTVTKEMQQINQRIVTLRRERGIKQSELAEKIGISQTNMSNIERGRTGITLDNLLKIREVLGCKMADFFVDIDGAGENADSFSDADIEKVVQLLKIIKTLR